MLRFSSLTSLPVLVVFLVCVHGAAAADSWLGTKVFLKSGAKPGVNGVAIDLKLIPYPATVADVKGDWLWLGRAWIRKQDVVALDRAVAYFTEEIRRNPSNSYGYFSRGSAYRNLGDLDHALDDYNHAMRLDPRNAATYDNRGVAWVVKGELDNALKDFTEAIRLNQKSAIAYCNRGSAWEMKGELDNALKDFAEATRVDPKGPRAYNSIAWLRATCFDARYRDGKPAVQFATNACELSRWLDNNHLDTLAAACAEAGDFDSAVKWQTKALGLLKDEKKRTGFQERLALYENKQPYREPRPKSVGAM